MPLLIYSVIGDGFRHREIRFIIRKRPRNYFLMGTLMGLIIGSEGKVR
jgi:hypothetical protein